MPIFQAAIDDSASDTGDRRLFLAGFLTTADQWAKFSDSWARQLKANKPIAYLKTSEANKLEGEFRGWTTAERDEKLKLLKGVIDEFEPLSFHASVSRCDTFERYKATAPRGLGRAHFPCCFAVMSGLAQFAASQGATDPIQFIFDTQDGVDDDIDLFFDYMAHNLPDNARRLIAGKPQFESDKAFAPLQAADMLAWHLRRRHEETGSWMHDPNNNTPLNRHAHLDIGEVDRLLPGWIDAFEKMPGIAGMQAKAPWQKIKKAIREALTSGWVPPR